MYINQKTTYYEVVVCLLPESRTKAGNKAEKAALISGHNSISTQHPSSSTTLESNHSRFSVLEHISASLTHNSHMSPKFTSAV